MIDLSNVAGSHLDWRAFSSYWDYLLRVESYFVRVKNVYVNVWYALCGIIPASYVIAVIAQTYLARGREGRGNTEGAGAETMSRSQNSRYSIHQWPSSVG